MMKGKGILLQVCNFIEDFDVAIIMKFVYGDRWESPLNIIT